MRVQQRGPVVVVVVVGTIVVVVVSIAVHLANGHGDGGVHARRSPIALATQHGHNPQHTQIAYQANDEDNEVGDEQHYGPSERVAEIAVEHTVTRLDKRTIRGGFVPLRPIRPRLPILLLFVFNVIQSNDLVVRCSIVLANLTIGRQQFNFTVKVIIFFVDLIEGTR